jgi:biotin-[acetyl-CoA-carboxylase] ligase BirA-like protein
MPDPAATRSPRPPWRVERFASIDSTNKYVHDEARAGAPAGLVAVAEHQRAGRGRLGRTWEAAPGSSLLVSVLLRPEIAADHLGLLTMAAGVALAQAVEAVAGVQAGLKWPNDLVVGDRKLAGLLAEADLGAAGVVRAVVIGAGCIVTAVAVPAELAGQATACELEAGGPVDRDAAHYLAIAHRLMPHEGSDRLAQRCLEACTRRENFYHVRRGYRVADLAKRHGGVRVIERRPMPPLGHFSLIRFERLADDERRNAA